MTVAYAAFHLIGWDFWFPTRIERNLWRASSLIATVTTIFFWLFETIAARQRFGRWDKYLIALKQQKAKSVQWWEVALLFPVVVAYVAARAYMIVEVLVSLRRLPLGAYKTVQVSQNLPHW